MSHHLGRSKDLPVLRATLGQAGSAMSWTLPGQLAARPPTYPAFSNSALVKKHSRPALLQAPTVGLHLGEPSLAAVHVLDA